MNSDENPVVGALKSVINDLSSKEVSLLQIVRDNTGVITFTENDFQWIEQISRAILITNNDEYFQRVDQSLNFDFLYLQSYIIRTHLLLCPINYEHVIQNYQCYVRRTNVNAHDAILDLDDKYCIQLNHQQLEIDWNHLKEMQMDKLYHGHHLLRHISFILKHQQEDRSQINLFEFIQSLGDDQNIRHQIEQYEIKDFQLCYIDHIRTLYQNSISDFQHLFTDVSQTLRAPIDPQLEIELNETFHAAIVSVDHDKNVNEIQSIIKQITDLLNDLRSVEHQLSDQSAHPLKETCEILSIENVILAFIPDGIKCENYVALSIHIIRMRRILQERIVNIEEKETEQWDENIDVQPHEEQLVKPTNRFRDLLAEPPSNEEPNPVIIANDEDIWPEIPDYIQQNPPIDYFLDRDDLPFQQQQQPQHRPIAPPILIEERLTYSSLFQLNLKLVPLTSSNIFQKIHQQIEERPPTLSTPNKAQKFVVTYPTGDSKVSLWKSENLFERLRAIFDKEKYQNNNYIVIDKHGVLLDFPNVNARLPKDLSLEYSIIDKKLVFPIQFHFQTKTFDYFITSNCDILHLINRFISDYEIQLSSKDTLLGFFDQHGKTIDDVSIADLVNRLILLQQNIISITVIEGDKTNAMLYEVTFRSNQGKLSFWRLFLSFRILS